MQISNLHVILQKKFLRKCTRQVRGAGLNFSQCFAASPSAGTERRSYPPPALYFGGFSGNSRSHGSSLYSSYAFHGGGTDGHVYVKKPECPSLWLGMHGSWEFGARRPMAFPLGRSSDLRSEFFTARCFLRLLNVLSRTFPGSSVARVVSATLCIASLLNPLRNAGLSLILIFLGRSYDPLHSCRFG